MSAPQERIGDIPPGWTEGSPERRDARLAVESRIVEMHRLLDRMRPQSSAEALGALRAAFPDVPLAQRVAAATRQPGER